MTGQQRSLVIVDGTSNAVFRAQRVCATEAPDEQRGYSSWFIGGRAAIFH
jgi:hypothetical protein